jgi:hypothetical protein
VWLRLHVRLQPEKRYRDLHQTWHRKENTKESKLGKSALCSIFGKGGSCSSETKHDRRTSRSNLFASKKKLQKQSPQHRKTTQGPISGKNGLCSSENNIIEVERQKQSCLFRRGGYKKTKATIQKIVLGSSSNKVFSVARKIRPKNGARYKTVSATGLQG